MAALAPTVTAVACLVEEHRREKSGRGGGNHFSFSCWGGGQEEVGGASSVGTWSPGRWDATQALGPILGSSAQLSHPAICSSRLDWNCRGSPPPEKQGSTGAAGAQSPEASPAGLADPPARYRMTGLRSSMATRKLQEAEHHKWTGPKSAQSTRVRVSKEATLHPRLLEEEAGL